VVDTDVLSYQFKGDSRARFYDTHVAGQIWVISFMTLAELKWWALHRRWGRKRRNQLSAHLRRVQVYYADEDLCDGGQKWCGVPAAAAAPSSRPTPGSARRSWLSTCGW
jgi:tRNA(fMet)-specific endonuclease VapC